MKLIMFDMDGTLYRSETSFFPAVQEFADKYGFSRPDNDFLRGFIGQAGKEWRTWIESLHLGKPTDELDQEFSALERHYVETQGQLYPNVPDVLRELSTDGWHLGICSNAPSWYPEVILTNAGVRNLFNVIRVPQRPGETKPVMLCEVWNELHPEDCVMVGDRADDMQAALAGGFFPIGAAYGWAPEELGRAAICINDIREIPAVLANRHAAAAEAGKAPVPDAQPQPCTLLHSNDGGVFQAGAAPAAEPVSATPQPARPVAPVQQPAATPEPAAPVPTPSAVTPAPAPEPPAASEPAQPSPRRSWNPFHRR